MPIDKSKYPPDWDEISLKKRQGAGWKCEWCGAVHGERHPITGSRVILTVHHIGVAKPDGTPGSRHDKLDCRDENLAALCQRCHWIADWDIHHEKAVAAIREKKYQIIAGADRQKRMFDE